MILKRQTLQNSSTFFAQIIGALHIVECNGKESKAIETADQHEGLSSKLPTKSPSKNKQISQSQNVACVHVKKSIAVYRVYGLLTLQKIKEMTSQICLEEDTESLMVTTQLNSISQNMISFT